MTSGEVAVTAERDPTGSQSFGESARLMFRILTFRATQTELIAVNHRDLALGLLVTWIVGIGRYWDNDRVELLQKMGVGSVIYVFVLAAFLFIFMMGIRPKNFSYFRMLVFITMTSLPAVIYAIPVQMIYPEPGLETANEINLMFLGVVAMWRLSLLIWYAKRLGELDPWDAIVAVFFPIGTIIISLYALNLERVVFSFMSGIRDDNISPNDDSYSILLLLSMIVFAATIPLLIAYIVTVYLKWRKPKYEPVEPNDLGIH